jgi:hypothetical protein
VLAYLCGIKPSQVFRVLIAVTLVEPGKEQNGCVATAMEEWASLNGEDGPNSSCASRQMCSALGLSSFTEALVQAYSNKHYGAAHISKTKHTTCRYHVRECKYKIHTAAIFVRVRFAP